MNKVFGIGLSRTGTKSLHLILEQLGLRSIHFIPPLLDEPDWSIIDTADCFTDGPIPMIFKECDERYSNSKFILTLRDKSQWLESMKWMYKYGKVIWRWPEQVKRYQEEFYGSREFNEKILSDLWERHHENVEEYFRKRQADLFTVNIDEGFNISELCRFLQVPEKIIEVFKSNSKRYPSVRQWIKYFLSPQK